VPVVIVLRGRKVVGGRAEGEALVTHMTVPGWLNYHQAVTRWVLERHDLPA